MVEFNSLRWTCNRCGKSHRVRRVYEDGEYLKTCKCGRTMLVKIKMDEHIIKRTMIVGLRDISRRCDRGGDSIK